ARRTSTSSVKALLEWRNASRDDETRTAGNISFWDMVSLTEFQATPDFIIGHFVEAIEMEVCLNASKIDLNSKEIGVAGEGNF
ncbi:unnamed protein product, partial [Hymenolepis diminuta]